MRLKFPSGFPTPRPSRAVPFLLRATAYAQLLNPDSAFVAAHSRDERGAIATCRSGCCSGGTCLLIRTGGMVDNARLAKVFAHPL